MMRPGIRTYFGEDLGSLAQTSAPLLLGEGLGPLDAPWVVVPSLAIRQWLDRAIADGSRPTGGVAANMEVFFPDQLVAHIFSLALGGDRLAAWEVDAIAVRILASNCQMSFDEARRQAVLVDELVRWRPERLRKSELSNFSPRLNATIEQLGLINAGPHIQRAEALGLIEAGTVKGIPTIVVFGLLGLPEGRNFLDVLRSLSAVARVECFVPVPDVDLAREVLEGALDPLKAQTELDSPWLNDSLESLGLWAELDAEHHFDEVRRQSDPQSALGRLQARLVGRDGVEADPDASVLVLGGYDTTRQVEVLRDVAFSVIDGGASPEDLLLAAPDVGPLEGALERHWNHRWDEDRRSPRLPYEMAIRSSRSANNRANASVALLRSIGNYATLDDVSNLLAFPGVAKGLHLGFDDVQSIINRAEEGKIIFGTSPEQRTRFGVYPESGKGGFSGDIGTWQRLCDRIAIASLYPPGDDGEPDSFLPLEPIGEAADLAPMAMIQPLLRIMDEWADLRGEGEAATRLPLTAWLDRLARWMTTVTGLESRDFSFERVDRRIRSWFAEDESLGETELTFMQFEDLWANQVTERSISKSIGKFGVVVSNLRALEWVPFDYVALTGLDEASLPRTSMRSEVMAERRLGDPDPRQTALGSLLATTLAARKGLVVCWSARDERTGGEAIPSLPLLELFGALDAVAPVNEGWEKSTRAGATRHQYFGNDHVVVRRDGRIHVVAEGSIDLEVVHDQPDELELSYEALRSYYRNPARAFLRHATNVEPPEPLEGFPAVPRVDVDGLERWQGYEALRTAICATESWVALAAHYQAGDLKEKDRGGRWLGDQRDVRAAIGRVMADEGLVGDRPEAIWGRTIDVDAALALVTGLAMESRKIHQVVEDHPMFTPIDIDGLGPVSIPSDGVQSFFERELPAMDRTLLAARRFSFRDKAPDDLRHLLEDLIFLLFVRCAVPEAVAGVLRYDLPSADKASKLLDGLKGGFARRKLLSIHPDDLDDVGARRALSMLVGLRDRGMEAPIPLFAKTTVKYLKKALDGGRDAWDRKDGKYEGRPESMEVPHRLLFPLTFDQVVAETEFDEIARQLEQVLVRVRSSAQTAAESDPRQTMGKSKSLDQFSGVRDLGLSVIG